MVQKNQNKQVVFQPPTWDRTRPQWTSTIDEILSRNHTWNWFGYGCFPKIGVPQNRWVYNGKPLSKWMIWGEKPPYFRKPPYNMGFVSWFFQPSIAFLRHLCSVFVSLQVFTLRGCSPSSRGPWHWTCTATKGGANLASMVGLGGCPWRVRHT